MIHMIHLVNTENPDKVHVIGERNLTRVEKKPHPLGENLMLHR